MVRIVGISDASPPFASLPVMHSRYSQAVNFVGRERTQLSFLIARPVPGVTAQELTARIQARTGLRARTTKEFMWDCVRYYLKNTGIPVNFGITIAVALVVGTVVAGQTFYLFTVDNLKQFGALKAIGVTNLRLTDDLVGPSASGPRLCPRHGHGGLVLQLTLRSSRLATSCLCGRASHHRRHVLRRHRGEPPEHSACSC
jgi:hypothetical protein